MNWIGYVLGAFLLGQAFGGYSVYNALINVMPEVFTSHPWHIHATVGLPGLLMCVVQWVANQRARQKAGT